MGFALGGFTQRPGRTKARSSDGKAAVKIVPPRLPEADSEILSINSKSNQLWRVQRSCLSRTFAPRDEAAEGLYRTVEISRCNSSLEYGLLSWEGGRIRGCCCHGLSRSEE